MARLTRGRLFGETVEDGDELIQPAFAFDLAKFDAFGHTLLDVCLDDSKADAIERGFGGGELLKDFDAEARFFHHPADPAHLAFDAVQARDECLLPGCVQHKAVYAAHELRVSAGYDGCDVRIYDRGSGPPIIVIPGVQGRFEWFTPTLAALGASCRTISYTLAGDLGSGRRLDPKLGFENYLQQVDEVFERTGLTRAAVCGISYGGLIAVRYAASRPERVAALVIASSPGPGWRPDPMQAACIAHPWRKALTFVATAPGRVWPEVHEARGSLGTLGFLARHGLRAAAAPMIPGLMAARIVETQSIDFSADWAAVQCPTLVTSGEPHLDRIVPVESTRKYAEMIPGAKYVMLEKTGHLGMVTRASEWAALVARFVDQAGNTRG